MSGIAGIFYLDGRPAEQETIDQMVGAMKHRGPDGIHTWREGSVALGHCMLHTTPESLHDNLPMTSRDGNFVLTADARIDNREELMRVLELRPGKDRPVTDCDLIMAAYQKWGEACPEHLLGAFAFAIWDKRDRSLFCARDHFGLKPLYYSWEKRKYFAFSNSTKSLTKINLVSLNPCKQRIAEYLANINSNNEYTFYENIKRLKPGSVSVISMSEKDDIKYFRYEKEQSKQECIDDSVSKFKHTLINSVERRVRAQSDCVASLLSGGLDSSAIEAVSRKLIEPKGKHKISLNFKVNLLENSLDEDNKYLNYLQLESNNISYISIDKYNLADDIKDMVRDTGSPLVLHPLNLLWRAGPHVQQSGKKVVLMGSGGDDVVSHGHYYVSELARKGQWIKVIRELQGKNLSYLISLFIKFGPIPNRLSSRILPLINKKKKSTIDGWRSDIRPEVIHRYNLNEIWNKSMASILFTPTEKEHHIRSVLSPRQVAAVEDLYHSAAEAGLELRLPYWDKELVELCLNMPTEHRRANGIGRLVLRRATKNILPEPVRTRQTKTDFTLSLKRETVANQEALYNLGQSGKGLLQEFVEPDKVLSLLKKDPVSWWSRSGFVFRAIMLAAWHLELTTNQ
jgi:asparagine synthase (glutamine-hydrolysing)